MDRSTFPASAESELQFLLSLVHISAPGEPRSEHAAAIEQLLPAAGSKS